MLRSCPVSPADDCQAVILLITDRIYRPVIIAVVLFSLGRRNGGEDIYDTVSMEAVPLDGRAFVEPRNETEFRELFEKLAGKLYGYDISLSQAKCPDLMLFDRQAKKTIRAEIEYRASDFFKHKHKWDAVDMIICWVNDIEKSDIPILECRNKITEYYKSTAGAK